MKASTINQRQKQFRAIKKDKKILPPAKQKQSRRTPYDGPTNILQCLQQVRAAQAHYDTWLVATCQHIAMRGLSREAVRDILHKDRTNEHLTLDDCDIIAGRLVTLSRNEDALMDLKYGTQPLARRITLKKKAM